MSNIILSSLALMLQPSTPPVPPKMGPPPPVGDVPLDGNLWVLIATAVALGIIFIYNKRRRNTL